ncbi:MAG: bifunctional protein-serine/threonine kinase/phosphatase [Mariprofundales bacterium]
MSSKLIVQAGQCSQAGVKSQNEDCCGIYIPDGMDLTHKGVIAVTADGVGSSEASKEASEYCVQGLISDYYSTPISWSVQSSAERIIHALNSWLYSQAERRYASELSMASTLAVLILKSTTAHLFHVGDSRIYLIRDGEVRLLTKDHRLVAERNKIYLARAMGGEYDVNVDCSSLAIKVNDVFVLNTDGAHEFVGDKMLKSLVLQDDCELAAQQVVKAALDAGSSDNVTCQVLRIAQLPNQNDNEYFRELTMLPFPPPLSAGMVLDNYTIIRELHTSVTIQVYLAEERSSGERVVVKTPSVNFEDDPAYIDRFMHEEWVGRRINNPHVFKVHQLEQHRSCLYYVTEFLEGNSLAQWILDNPTPDLGEVRRIIEEIIKGLRGFHRKEMVHQDLKPDNIMIDRHGHVKVIDFGCVQVAGLKEIYTPVQDEGISGTVNYIAPELFDGFEGTPKSDMYSLGVTLYAMLTQGHFPYAELEKAERHKDYNYISVRQYNLNVPVWMDGAIQKAVHPNPDCRYERFSELLIDLSKPNADIIKNHIPLIERSPVIFWRSIAIIMFIINIVIAILLIL